MSKALPLRALGTALLALASVAAQAQAHDGHAAHGDAAPPAETATAPAMDHGAMQMQGGSAPADARDPHAYADGLQRGAGDYAVPGVPRLAMADEHPLASLRVDTLERRFATGGGDDSTAYDLEAWYGGTYNRAVQISGDVLPFQSQPIYIAGLGLTAIQPLLGVAAYTIVALIWLIPDRRVEHFVTRAHQD